LAEASASPRFGKKYAASSSAQMPKPIMARAKTPIFRSQVRLREVCCMGV
jgi:hypothetical protein